MRALGPALPATFGRYTLFECVGGGGMASVFRATLRGEGGFEKEVAVKVVRPELASDPQFVEMFVDEARLSARLGHGNLVQTFDFGQVDGTWFLAMEFVRGPTLAKLLRIGRARGLPLGAARSLHLAGEVARGLGYAHRLRDENGAEMGLVHRDVSPQNVLISREGEVKLADFGIAKAAARSTVTRTGHVRGKCAYMAPEQARGEPLDARADVFALGVVLWECLTGQPLFDGASDGAVLLQVVQREIPPPSRFAPAVPAALDELVLRMLARDRSLRPANGDAVARELAELKLRLVRSPGEIDLAAFQRELASGTDVVGAVPRGPAAPPSSEVELGSEAILEAVSSTWVDPQAETREPALVREEASSGATRVARPGTGSGEGPAVAPPGLRGQARRERRAGIAGAIAVAVLLVAGGWWAGRSGTPGVAAGDGPQMAAAQEAGGGGTAAPGVPAVPSARAGTEALDRGAGEGTVGLDPGPSGADGMVAAPIGGTPETVEPSAPPALAEGVDGAEPSLADAATVPFEVPRMPVNPTAPDAPQGGDDGAADRYVAEAAAPPAEGRGSGQKPGPGARKSVGSSSDGEGAQPLPSRAVAASTNAAGAAASQPTPVRGRRRAQLNSLPSDAAAHPLRAAGPTPNPTQPVEDRARANSTPSDAEAPLARAPVAAADPGEPAAPERLAPSTEAAPREEGAAAAQPAGKAALGRLVLVSKDNAPFTALIDGAPLTSFEGASRPREFDLPAGRHELRIREDHGNWRCNVGVELSPTVRTTVLVSEMKVYLLDGQAKVEVVCPPK